MAGFMETVRGWFGRGSSDPADPEGGAVATQWPSYRLLWAYYENSAFEHPGMWAQYKGRHGLYRGARLLYNPTKRLCDFYATHLYPGALAADPAAVPAGQQMAIPLADDTTPETRAALDQLWAWSRWQANKSVLGRYGAVAGNVLIEAVDDLDAGRVYAGIVWPALVASLDLDPTGEVRAYALEYPARDDSGGMYRYRKEVDLGEIRFLKDGRPFDYGEGTSYPNPYGFVPAVWIKHVDLGGNLGAPAIHGSVGKVDELNSLASHIHDQVHKVIGAPILIASDGKVGSLLAQSQGAAGKAKRPSETPYDLSNLDREGLLMLTAPKETRVESLAGNLQLHEAAEHLAMLQAEIEADHPEMAMYRELRGMSQVTGPAATRLMGDVVRAVGEVAANYDAGCAALFAMCLAIGGWRLASGDWDAPTAEQSLFASFNLDQYRTDALRIRILPRQLIQMSEEEALQVQQLRDSIKAGVQATLAANLRETINT